MKQIFEEYTAVLVISIIVVALIGIVMLLRPVFEDKTSEMVNTMSANINEISDILDYRYEEFQINDKINRYNNEGRCSETQAVWSDLATIEKINMLSAIGSSDEFIAPIKDVIITAGVWHYPDSFQDGAIHLGIDYGAEYGSKIFAPANGIILLAETGCPYGELGSLCGGDKGGLCGAGNQIYMMCQVDNKVYVFIIMHMSSVNVNRGQIVRQNDLIGKVGSSGSSTGAHAHIEMYYLGEGEIADYLPINLGSTMSVGRGASALNYKCEDGNKSEKGVCILDPSKYLPSGNTEEE